MIIMKKIDEVLDKKSFELLISHFGGRRIWIPKKGNPGYRNPREVLIRNTQLINLFREGIPVKELSKKFKLSRNRIYDIVNRYFIKPSSNQ